MRLVGVVLALCAFANGQTPSLVLRNAASFTNDIAPGALVEIFSTAAPLIDELLLNDRRIPLVRSPRGVFQWAAIPLDIAPGQARVTVFAGNTRHETTVTIQPHAPGLFAANNGGSGPALSANRLTNPALAGDYLTLWGTGLGNFRDVFVNLAGRVVRAQYAGHHPDYPGLDQINFQAPAGAWIGCYVPVSIRVGDAESNRVTVAISDAAGACPHPLGVTYTDLVTLDAGGTILAGAGSLSFQQGQSSFTSVRFEQLNAWGAYLAAGPQQPDSEFLGCSVSRFGGAAGGLAPRSADAGPFLTFTAPGGARYNSGGLGESPNLSGSYQWGDDIPLLPGQWLLSAPGGAAIGAFQQVLPIPPPLRDFTPPARIDRHADLPLTWNPFGYASGDLLRITVSSTRGVSVSCLTHTWTGRMTIAADLLAQLPAGEGFVSTSISPHPATRTRFDVPRAGGGTAPVMLTYGIGTTGFVEIR